MYVYNVIKCVYATTYIEKELNFEKFETSRMLYIVETYYATDLKQLNLHQYLEYIMESYVTGFINNILTF